MIDIKYRLILSLNHEATSHSNFQCLTGNLYLEMEDKKTLKKFLVRTAPEVLDEGMQQQK